MDPIITPLIVGALKSVFAFGIGTKIVTDFVSGGLNRNQQREIAEKNRESQERLERNRQNFQLRLNRENAEVQRQLVEQNHQNRLKEQREGCKLAIATEEYKQFLQAWPLYVPPIVFREGQFLADSVALRVFFSKSDDPVLKKIFPGIEQGMVDFTRQYPNVFGSKNIMFYDGAFKANCRGDAFNAIIHFALNKLPVLIIDSNASDDNITVSATRWGFGDNDCPQSMTLFRVSYERKNVLSDKKYAQSLENQLLAHIKYVIGNAYDAYSLVMHDQPPLLPHVAKYELENGVESSPLQYESLKNGLAREYDELYTTVLGTSAGTVTGGRNSEGDQKLLLQNFKKPFLHLLRLEYAESVADFATPESYRKYLDESITAWVELRTKEDPGTFITNLISGKYQLGKYIAQEDYEYLTELADCYKKYPGPSCLGEECIKLHRKIERVLAVEDNFFESWKWQEQPKTLTAESCNLEMIRVAPGTFIMGSPEDELGRWDGEKQHRVTLAKGFWLGKYPVTQAQYKAVMGKNPSYFKGDKLPVECVSWNDAIDFCAKLTEIERKAGRLPEGYKYTLPTEAQWEYACRAGTTTALNNGKNLTSEYGECPNLDEVGWYNENSKGQTHPVGEKKPNAWGFYDMHGNVWEWCLDWYGGYPTGAVTDPMGPSEGSNRVVRGGSWYIDADFGRSARRRHYDPSRSGFYGFRAALSSCELSDNPS